MLPQPDEGRTFDFFAIGYPLIKVPRVALSRQDNANHAILPHGYQLT